MINSRFMTISGHFSASYIEILHKTEVQTVILRCLMGLNLDWFKIYGLWCKWRPCACLANFQKIATDKWSFYYHFWPFFCHLCIIFHKKEIQTLILKCLMILNLIWYNSYDTKHKNANCKTPKIEIFPFCVITLEPIRF